MSAGGKRRERQGGEAEPQGAQGVCKDESDAACACVCVCENQDYIKLLHSSSSLPQTPKFESEHVSDQMTTEGKQKKPCSPS